MLCVSWSRRLACTCLSRDQGSLSTGTIVQDNQCNFPNSDKLKTVLRCSHFNPLLSTTYDNFALILLHYNGNPTALKLNIGRNRSGKLEKSYNTECKVGYLTHNLRTLENYMGCTVQFGRSYN